MASDLVIALAGGAVGSALTVVGAVSVRLGAVPGEVRRHDRRTRALDEDLERWVADDHRRLRQELDGITNDMAARNLLYSGIHGGARAEAKTRALQRYRDQRSQAERTLADLLAEESWPHDLYRAVRRRGRLALRAPDRVEAVIDDWRADVTRHGDRAPVHDPTQQTLSDLLSDVHERPLEPAVEDGQ